MTGSATVVSRDRQPGFEEKAAPERHLCLTHRIVSRYGRRWKAARQAPEVGFRWRCRALREAEDRQRQDVTEDGPDEPPGHRQLEAAPARVSEAVCAAICDRSCTHLSRASTAVGSLPPAVAPRCVLIQPFMATSSLSASVRLAA